MLGLVLVSGRMTRWWRQVSPFLEDTHGEETLSSRSEQVPIELDWFLRAVELVKLTATQQLTLDSKAVAPYALHMLNTRVWETNY